MLTTTVCDEAADVALHRRRYAGKPHLQNTTRVKVSVAERIVSYVFTQTVSEDLVNTVKHLAAEGDVSIGRV